MEVVTALSTFYGWERLRSVREIRGRSECLLKWRGLIDLKVSGREWWQ
jgi:hypothetical protein